MKHHLSITFVLAIIFSSCHFNKADDFEFGVKYNTVRAKFGSPLIKRNMAAVLCCREPTMYSISEIPVGKTPYHSSKTIRLFSDGRIYEEKDIYRISIDDTTILQLNILSEWDWGNNKLNLTGNSGKIDKRDLKLGPTDYLQGKSNKYPNYDFIDLDAPQIDSVLHSWGLSRFDKE